jgi:hypothetical protein
MTVGEQRTLPLVARSADACSLIDIPDGGTTLRRKVDVLARNCDAAGRDLNDIEIALSSRLADGESAQGFAERFLTFSESRMLPNHAAEQGGSSGA